MKGTQRENDGYELIISSSPPPSSAKLEIYEVSTSPYVASHSLPSFCCLLTLRRRRRRLCMMSSLGTLEASEQ